MSDLGNAPNVEQVDPPRVKKQVDANFVKDVHRKKLQREVFADPDKLRELVKVEASPVYNASGELIQAVTTTK